MKKQKILSFIFYVLGGFVIIGTVAFSSSLFFSSTPSPTTHTLSDIYQKLTNNSYTASIAESFNFPTGEATSTMATVEQIYNLIPTISSSTIATGTSILGVTGNIVIPNASDVLSVSHFGVDGQTQGLIATQVLSPATTTVSSGYYATSNLSTVDTDLVSSNIATGTNIFGVVGSKVPAAAALVWSVGTTSKNRAAAISYCSTLTEGGVSAGTWRLPSIADLISAFGSTYLSGNLGGSVGSPGGFVSNTQYWSISYDPVEDYYYGGKVVFGTSTGVFDMTLVSLADTSLKNVRCVR